jgi:hypothetical protein
MKAGVAGLTICDGFNIFHNLVLDFEVALVAFNLVGRNVHGMDQISIPIFIEPLFFKVAFVAVLTRDGPVADDGVAVAFVTFETVVKDKGVIVS